MNNKTGCQLCTGISISISTNTNIPPYSVTISMKCIPVLVLVSTNTNAPLYNVIASIKERGTKVWKEFKETNKKIKN